MDHQSLTSPGFKIQSNMQYPMLVRGISIWEKYNESIQRSCQGRGGSHVARLNFKTSRVGVYKIMLFAYCRLCRHCRNLAKEGCLLSQFHFIRCHYFLGHVASQNLTWQDLYSLLNCCYGWRAHKAGALFQVVVA